MSALCTGLYSEDINVRVIDFENRRGQSALAMPEAMISVYERCLTTTRATSVYSKPLRESCRCREGIVTARFSAAQDQDLVSRLRVVVRSTGTESRPEITALREISSTTEDIRDPHAQGSDPLSSRSQCSTCPVLIW